MKYLGVVILSLGLAGCEMKSPIPVKTLQAGGTAYNCPQGWMVDFDKDGYGEPWIYTIHCRKEYPLERIDRETWEKQYPGHPLMQLLIGAGPLPGGSK